MLRSKRPFVLPSLARLTGAALAVAGLFAAASPARAARPFVSRDLVLSHSDVAFDIGLGIGHYDPAPGASGTGFGMNLALSFGLGGNVEIGARTGFRLDTPGQITQADSYGRTYDTETFGVGHDRVANPEIHIRWGLARGPSAELGFELRAIMPIEDGTRFGMVLGLPVALRTGVLRLDTGIHLPIIFYGQILSAISVPAHLWIQASPTFWLGPLFEIRVYHQNGHSWNQYPVGFGIGSALAPNLDLRAWFLFPDVNSNANYGGGIAFQIRFD
jgi:hypothetical protein